MQKTKKFDRTLFTAEVWRDAIQAFKLKLPRRESTFMKCEVSHGDGSIWSYDTAEEFVAELRKPSRIGAIFHIVAENVGLFMTERSGQSEISVKSAKRSDIEQIFEIFESQASACRLPEVEEEIGEKPRVFIGHGRNLAWRDLKDHLHDKHGMLIESYETGARAGHVIRDILDDMADRSSFAILVMTGEDEQSNGNLQARQNVIHEVGLFQGRLGFSRAIVLLEKNVDKFSNLDGIQYIEFSEGNIRETYGEVLATIRREFPPLN